MCNAIQYSKLLTKAFATLKQTHGIKWYVIATLRIFLRRIVMLKVPLSKLQSPDRAKPSLWLFLLVMRAEQAAMNAECLLIGLRVDHVMGYDQSLVAPTSHRLSGYAPRE